MKSKAVIKSRSTAKPKASAKTKAQTDAAVKTKAATKTKAIPKTKAVIYDSDGDADDATEEDVAFLEDKEPLYNPMESFQISRQRKLTVGRFQNGDAFVDIRESHPRKTSKRLRRGRGICLTLTQWRKILGLIPEIEKVANQIVSKKNT
ncbi:unnamed protein product [Mucor fragilis]